MKKRVFNRVVLALVMAVALCSMVGSALAAGADNLAVAEKIISPRYEILKKFYMGLTISTSGKASCSAKANVSSSYTVVVTTELQQNDGGWRTIKSQLSDKGAWVQDTMSHYVSSGSTYRVLGTAYVYDSRGYCVETETAYSDIISY